jgi:hypothetical protein
VDRTWAIRKTLIKAAHKQELASLYKGIGNMLQEEPDELNKRALGVSPLQNLARLSKRELKRQWTYSIVIPILSLLFLITRD